MSIKRRCFVRVISYLVVACVIVAASGLFSQRAKAGYEETLGKVRMANLGSLSEHFRDISAGLRLLAVSTENSFSDSSSYVEARIMGAKSCLNGFNDKKTKNIRAYLDALDKFMQDFSGTSEKRKIAIYLSEYAREVYYHLGDVSSAVMNGAYSLTEYGSVYRNDGIPYFEDFLDYSNGDEKELFGAAAPALANERVSYSDEVTEEIAMETAGKAVGLNPCLWRKNKEISDCYSFYHGDTLVNVAKSGEICKIINPMPCKAAKLTLEEAENIAIEFLADLGYENISASGREKSQFTASFLFYPQINGVLLMTCPVYADVCLSNGMMTYMDSNEYLKNYRNDIYPPEKLPDISGYIPEDVIISDSRYCLKEINQRETLCIMTECSYDGYDYYIYTDLQTFRILKTENA